MVFTRYLCDVRCIDGQSGLIWGWRIMRASYNQW